MNQKVAETLYSTMKVVGHLLIAAFVTGLIVVVGHNPHYVYLMPVVNIVTNALIKWFSITPEDMGTIDTAPPQV